MSTAAVRPWSVIAAGVSVTVRLTPKGGRDAIDGIETMADGRAVLKARVRAAPSDGDANEALIRLLAKTLDIPSRDVALASGTTARIKRLTIAGDGPTIMAALEKLRAPR
jgi:uncharacterized protein (TIGR00251 family)